VLRDKFGRVSVYELGRLTGHSWKSASEQARRLGLQHTLRLCAVCGAEFQPVSGANHRHCSRKCSAHSQYLKNKETVCRRARVGDLARRGQVPRKFQHLSDADVRTLFETYRDGRRSIKPFAQAHGSSATSLKNLFQAKFPAEYADTIEQKMSRSGLYKKGRAFEYRVKDFLIKQGYFVLRSPVSAGPMDLVGLKRGIVLLIQCKTNRALSKVERGILCDLSDSIGAHALLANRNPLAQNWAMEFWTIARMGHREDTAFSP